MVILSAKAATDLFKNHDLTFSDRKIIEIMRAHDYNKSSLALAPYGSYWRLMRKIVTVEMLVHKRIAESASIRRKCVENMLTWIQEEAVTAGDRGIHVARFVFLATFNLLGNLMLSRDLLSLDGKESGEFFSVMMRLMEWSGHPNPSDLFPWLKWMDLLGLKKKMNRDLGKALEIASKFVKEKLEQKKTNDNKDFLDVLIEFESNGVDEPKKLSQKELTIFILEIFLAGSETTSSTIEWAVTELLCYPDVLRKLKQELTDVVGNRKVEESDIDNLPYLKAVIKEIMRLHPPIPFLVPRRAVKDTKFKGYDIPEDTQVFVNVWAIGRDEEAWDDVNSFKPERFLGSNVDYKGNNYEFIPFGAGRRMCAGVPLAHRMLHLILGALIHEFEWKFGGDVCKENIDMKDKLGVTVRKEVSLFAVPTKTEF